MTKVAIVGGVGTHSDFSAELIRKLATDHDVIAVSRTRHAELESAVSDLKNVSFENGDLTDPDFATYLTEGASKERELTTYIHNAARFESAPFMELSAQQFRENFEISVMSAVTALQKILPLMANGTVVLSGATASKRGSAKCASFAVAKFGLRALAQSLAREYGPKGIHVASVIIDGVVWGARAEHDFGMEKSRCIDPEDLANVYLDLIAQRRSCWTHELDVRPFSETF